MCDSKKTKTSLIEELKTLRSRAAELERIEDEHKLAGEALRENERFLQDIFDAMQDGISVLDRDLNIVRVNLWMEKRYADRMPLVGKKCYTAYQKRKIVCTWCPSVRAIETGEKQTGIIPYPRTDKLTGWVELSAFPLKDADGKVTGVIEHVKDVTDRKKMEEALRESEQYYRGLVNCSTDVIWRVNLEGILTFVSPSVKVLCGFETEELIGAPFEKFLTEDGTRKAREFLERRKRGESGKGAITLEITHRRKDGTEFLAEIHSSPIFGADGELVGIQGVTRDITEHKRAEKALRESEERLRVALSAAQMGTWRWDPTTNQDTRDASLNVILGLEAVESTQPVDDFLQYVHPEYRDMVDAEIQRALREHRTYVAEFQIIRPAGCAIRASPSMMRTATFCI
jgi:PAS domain S-box-containing protein